MVFLVGVTVGDNFLSSSSFCPMRHDLSRLKTSTSCLQCFERWNCTKKNFRLEMSDFGRKTSCLAVVRLLMQRFVHAIILGRGVANTGRKAFAANKPAIFCEKIFDVRIHLLLCNQENEKKKNSCQPSATVKLVQFDLYVDIQRWFVVGLKRSSNRIQPTMSSNTAQFLVLCHAYAV